MWKIIKFILFLAVFLLLAPWLASLAYGSSGDSGQAEVRIEAAGAQATPKIKVFGGAIGGVTPGDLFYIDATGNSRDMVVNLYLINAPELVSCLRYLILEVVVYFQDDDGRWRKEVSQDGSPAPESYLTLQNSPVNLILNGYRRYKIAIDSGSYYCLAAGTGGKNITPQFYLTAAP